MKTAITIAASVAAALLAACAPVVEEPALAVSVRDVPAATLAEATGMPGEAIVTASVDNGTVTMIYREDMVTQAQVDAAPAKICAFGDKTVFSSAASDLPDYEIAKGMKQMTVFCG